MSIACVKFNCRLLQTTESVEQGLRAQYELLSVSIAEFRAVQPRRKLPPSARRVVVIIRLKMDCKEKDRLLEEYDHGVNEWAKAVQNLKDAGMGQSRYLELLSLVDDARARTQRAKAAQAKHVAEHGC